MPKPLRALPSKKVSAVSVIVACLFGFMWVAMGSGTLQRAKQKDFLNLYIGAQMAADGQFARLHDQELQLEYQQRIRPETEQLWPFVRPHFYALLLSPLSFLSFDAAFVLWTAMHTLLLLGCWIWAARKYGEDALILGAMYLPTAIGIANGQDCLFLLVIVIFSYRLAERGKDLAAGATVALTLMKFHLLLFLPLAMWIAGRKRMAAGYATAATFLVLLSLMLGGWDGADHYVAMLTDPNLAGLNPAPQKTISVQALQWNLFGRSYPALSLILAVCVGAVGWVAARGAPLWRWWTAGSLTSLLAVPHVYAYDAALFLLGIWLAAAHSTARLTRTLTGILAAPLVFFLSFLPSEYALMYAPAVGLLLLLVSLARENSVERAASSADSSLDVVADRPVAV